MVPRRFSLGVNRAPSERSEERPDDRRGVGGRHVAAVELAPRYRIALVTPLVVHTFTRLLALAETVAIRGLRGRRFATVVALDEHVASDASSRGRDKVVSGTV